MSEKFIIEGWVPFKGELFSSKQTTLQRLIDEKPYPSALAALQQSKKDHGYAEPAGPQGGVPSYCPQTV